MERLARQRSAERANIITGFGTSWSSTFNSGVEVTLNVGNMKEDVDSQLTRMRSREVLMMEVL